MRSRKRTLKRTFKRKLLRRNKKNNKTRGKGLRNKKKSRNRRTRINKQMKGGKKVVRNTPIKPPVTALTATHKWPGDFSKRAKLAKAGASALDSAPTAAHPMSKIVPYLRGQAPSPNQQSAVQPERPSPPWVPPIHFEYGLIYGTDIINKVIGYIPATDLSGREVKEAVCEIKYDSNTGHIFLSHINMGIFEGMEGYFKHLFSETLKEFKYRTVDHMDKPDRLFSVQENAESKEERQNKLNIYNEVLTQYGYSHTMEPPGIKVTPDRVAKELKPQEIGWRYWKKN